MNTPMKTLKLSARHFIEVIKSVIFEDFKQANHYRTYNKLNNISKGKENLQKAVICKHISIMLMLFSNFSYFLFTTTEMQMKKIKSRRYIAARIMEVINAPSVTPSILYSIRLILLLNNN